MLLDACVLAHCISECCSFVIVLTGGITNLLLNSFPSPRMCNNTMMAANNDQRKAHTQITTNIRKRSQFQKRIRSFVIMDNNTTLGTNCYKILRAVLDLASAVFCTRQSKNRPGICFI
ncbi:hypothetical protein GOODEAATRI_028564 [Goodea atripinnis]|uniref:Secreted protein n=1 Tax=Goodea atripinnis TaxID=208336 RepID=A0ABV0N524_9TELE